jgi:hypothetical protein
MITFIKTEGRSCPNIVCCHCGKRLTADSAIIHWNPDEAQPTLKVSCDSAACDWLTGPDYTMEADVFLAHLLKNSHFDADEAAEKAALEASIA